MKSLGFNIIRKHIKIEPLRWYYHCDWLGMLVRQDMISGSEFKSVVFHHVLSLLHIHLSNRFKKTFSQTNAEGNMYMVDWLCFSYVVGEKRLPYDLFSQIEEAETTNIYHMPASFFLR
jgi:hypothetical protein